MFLRKLFQVDIIFNLFLVLFQFRKMYFNNLITIKLATTGTIYLYNQRLKIMDKIKNILIYSKTV